MIRFIAIMSILTIAFPASGQSLEKVAPGSADKTSEITIARLEFDGFQYMANKRQDPSGQFFFQTGQLGEGMVILLYAEFSRPVLGVKKATIEQAILADGSQLEQHRFLNPETAFAFRLGSDASGIGIKAQLETADRKAADLMRFSRLAGTITVVEANGTTKTTSGLFEDKRNSEESVLGIRLQTAMKWANGRYYALNIENPAQVLGVTVLDEQGNEFPQTDSFETAGDNILKLYVDKPEGTPFKVRLTRPASIVTHQIPFKLEDFNLLEK